MVLRQRSVPMMITVYYTRMGCNGNIHVSTQRRVDEADDNASLYSIYLPGFPLGGGMPQTENRTKWPVEGGAISFQPGWFPGHSTAFIYVNLGFGSVPLNMSNNMVPPFQIVGPSADPYPGTFCLPHIPLPENATVNVGDNATIQIIETALHGAALYNVSFPGLPP